MCLTLIGLAGLLGGCAVVPYNGPYTADPYYGAVYAPQPAYAPVYLGPPVYFGFGLNFRSGGHHGGYRGGFHGRH
ncbi:MAG: hypothetical protein A3K04_04350 [Gallionellales bacterium RBG_16_56_9]|nr:MAG: hypothetical protein A3K04_04350 [Gallionellales bacterium RBG_16_56_9]